MGQAVKQGALVLAISCLLAGGNWLWGSARLSLVADPSVYELELSAPLVEISSARALFDEGAHLFIDTRPGNPQERPTIAGSFVIREAHFDDDLLALLDDLYPEDPIILFGDGSLIGTNNVAGRLQTRGYEDVQILRGGVAGWEKTQGDMGQPYLPEDFIAEPDADPDAEQGGQQ